MGNNMKCYPLTIGELRDMTRQLELNPPYQRRPVWKTKQRNLLLSSIFDGIPIPAIILHKHYDNRRNKDIYDVLDGKQRIETILHFIESLEIPNETTLSIKKKKSSGEIITITYSDLRSKKFNKEHGDLASKFWNYELPVIEYNGDAQDFLNNPVPTMEIFVRINSTGSTLKKNEIRHASNSTPFFQLGEQLEKKYHSRFVSKWKIFSESDVQRYIFHEFILELSTAIHFNKYTDRRKQMDGLLRNYKWQTRELDKIKKRFDAIILWMKNILPDNVFINTRFKNKSDFYSLFSVLNELIERKYVTKNTTDNKILGKALINFSKVIQEVSPKLKKYSTKSSFSKTEQESLTYVIASREATDSMSNRQIRNDYLMKFIKGGFILNKKDRKRVFDPNVKGVLWTTLLQRTQNPRCPNPFDNIKCKKVLTYSSAQVDHIYPWVRGGKTNQQNARLICDNCNKSKGSKV
jgi:hypothetical protein